MRGMSSPADADCRYLEPLFGLGPPVVCRNRLANRVPLQQLQLFAVAWFSHALAREGLVAYLEASGPMCLEELRRGLILLGDHDAAELVVRLRAQLVWDADALAELERRFPIDLHERAVDYARRHAAELTPLE